MKLKEFMEMVQECAKIATPIQEHAGAVFTKDGGISCVVYLDKNGELSDSDKGSMVQFTIGCTKA